MNIEDFPNELLECFLSQFDNQELQSLKSVSTKFHDVSENIFHQRKTLKSFCFTEGLDDDQSLEAVEKVKGITRFVLQCHRLTDQKLDYFKHEPFCQSVTHLDLFSNHYAILSKQKVKEVFPNVKKIKLDNIELKKPTKFIEP